jgi:ATP-dependent DNA helicase UvrD/PcrA
MMSNLLENLNTPQRETVKILSGPLLVLAGAGSGKTRVLTRRVANLVESGVAPRRIIAVTFTNKAAGELKERVEELIGKVDNLWIGTFHSIAARLLRMYGEKIGIDRHFVIYDSDDQKQMIKRILKDMGVQIDAATVRRTITVIESYRRGNVNKLFSPTDDVWTTYKSRMTDAKAVDFSGLIEQASLLKDDLGKMWDHVLVDEFQDTSRTQFDFLKSMVSKENNICVVGDDDQSIYSWRGAKPEYLLRFDKEFPGAKVITLDQNYRSTGNIIKAAGALVANNKIRRVKTLWTDSPMGEQITFCILDGPKSEARWVINYINKIRATGRSLNEFAILYRLNAQSRSFEEELRRAHIPYRLIGGLKFYDRAEIKDLVAYLRLSINKESENDILRVVNKPRRGVGKTSIERARQVALDQGVSLWSVFKNLPPQVKGGGRKGIQKFVDIIEQLTEIVEERSASALLLTLFELTDKMGMESPANDEEENRVENMNQLLESMVEFDSENPDSNLHDFLDEISLLTSEEEPEGDEGITLMTIHSAKGLEYDVVFLPGWEDGIFPLKRKEEEVNMEEERRLAYVSITRARERVFISRVRERGLYGPAFHMQASPFLKELPRECLNIERAEGGSGYGKPNTPYSASGRGNSSNQHWRKKSTGNADANSVVSKVKSIKSSTSSVKSSSGMAIGVAVGHKVFGKGVISAVVGEGKSEKAIVSFENGGTKVILVSFLTKL